MVRKLVFVIELIAICNFLFISRASCKNNQVKTEQAPSWVIDRIPEVNANNVPKTSSGGYYYLLVDRQESIGVEDEYYHCAYKLLNNEGVQSMSDINIDFDPSYQKLSIHKINLYRNGKKIDELQTHEIKTIQREAEMDRHLYDGSLTAVVNLKDVHVGDIIEYAYSKQGYNPMNKGNFYSNYNFEFTIPVKEIFTRLVIPNSKTVYFNYPAGACSPEVSKKNNSIEYVWMKKEVKALLYDNNVPGWYDSNHRVEISTFANWSDVVKLCLENYKVSEQELKNLRNETNGLFLQSNKDSLIVDIIRFVQDQVRYLAFESGLNAYKPIHPCKVFESRYGDCKAKSLLLCSILKLNSIGAYPVLVNSNGLKSKTSKLPSFELFNHCVVQIIYKGHPYYIDPTISNQGGDLNTNSFPDYGYGLVLKEGTIELVLMDNHTPCKTWVRNYFEVGKIGGAVNYKVITQYTGSNADDQRESMQTSSMEELTQSYLKYYSKSYPSIRSLAPISYKDDRIQNSFTVEETYSIDSMWLPVKENARKLRMSITALAVNGVVNTPASPERSMPYFVSYPLNILEETYIDLPTSWSVTPESMTIEDSAFRFFRNISYTNNQIHLRYEYKTFKDNVPAKEFKAYYSKHDKISDHLSYELTYNTNMIQPFKFNGLIGLFVVFVLVICIYFAVKIYRNYNLPPSFGESREIGGWLVLIAIGLFFTTLLVTYQFFIQSKYFDSKTWNVLFESTLSNRIPLAILMLFEVIFNTALIVYLILLQFLFYKKRNVFPRMIILYFASYAIFILADTYLANSLSSGSADGNGKSYVEMGRAILYGIIWISYFTYSKRVKETFTTTNLTIEGDVVFSSQNKLTTWGKTFGE